MLLGKRRMLGLINRKEDPCMRSNQTRRLSLPLPILRAVVVITAIMAMAGGVTFAALQSPQAKLTGSTIQTATANLQVSSDGINYAAGQQGYAFGGLVPGGLVVAG